MRKPRENGYRIDLKSSTTGTWCEYTGLRRLYPLSQLSYVRALAEGLERQRQVWRIVEATGREKTATEYVRIEVASAEYY